MKKIINKVLSSSSFDDYSYVSVNEYIKQRSLVFSNDNFSDYSKLKDYQTIITVLMSYPSETVPYKGKGYGILSRYSYGTDYHIVLNKELDKVTKVLNEYDIKTHSSVDISFIDERFAASLSNLGYIGKNNFLINKKYGSYVYLATILIDKLVEEDINVKDDCNGCSICVDACPVSALDNHLDVSKCLSALSQNKEIQSVSTLKHYKEMIYGCDICQNVCPKNKLIDFHLHPEFEPSGIENIKVIDLFKMSNKEYKDIYLNNASSWKGPLIIKRNALGIIINQNLVEFIPVLTESMVKYKDVLWYYETVKAAIKEIRK
ncbi:hypothetical protein CI105_08655 [Candidatus Izimaplasma bacterium ZiA1]|uniref:epoxyqueuosine reductase n=1 Tax=Candidatus Izimoplasma sp. ZiA1 TaxID=2024899 RepID=UPI000BAA9202|nr:hypothetical protein CI105_08655 [Candidatus Izimaplasma bacterium ZiA1]